MPANVLEGLTTGGDYFQQQFVASTLAIFENGRFAWDVSQVNLINGAPNPGFPQGATRTIGPYQRRDSLLVLSWMFTAKVVGDTLYMTDIGGGFNHALFEFRRNR